MVSAPAAPGAAAIRTVHLVPPTTPAGTPDEFVQVLPIGGGFRVPAIIVSPWTVSGWVAPSPSTSSALQFPERFTDVEEPDVTDWRRAGLGG